MSRTGAYSYGQTGQRYGSSISGQPTSRYSRYSTTLPSANATTTRSTSSVRDVFRSTAASTRLPSSTSRAPYSSLPSSTSRTSYTSLPATTSRSAYSTSSTIRTPTTAAAATHPNGTCDKCDGPHQTDKCTVFTKGRENHVDATRRRPPKDIGGDAGSGPGAYLSSARVVSQPGDGSCLFHSLAYGMGRGNARELRREISRYIATHEDLEIAGDMLRDWVKWDSGTSVSSYCSRMSVSGWGGGIEMAAFSRMLNVNVHVYERCGGRVAASFKRVSAFNVPAATKTIRVLYRGGVHFDALVA